MDYEAIIKEKFPSCSCEVINQGDFEIKKLIEYINDDILVRKPHLIHCFSNFIRFFVNSDDEDKIYYLVGLSSEELKLLHGGLLKFTWKSDTKINLIKDANPEKEILGL